MHTMRRPRAITFLAIVSGTHAFMGTASLRMVPYGSRASSPAPGSEDARVGNTPPLRMTGSDGSASRGNFAKTLLGGGAVGLATILSPTALQPVQAAASLEELEADLMLCKEVFKPTLRYLKAEQFDAARTNTNYITRFFNLKKKIDAFIVSASDVVDDADDMERAFDMAQEIEALFTNFDSSVYTIIFIPADSAGVLPPGAEKYLKQAYGYYDDINRVLDFYIGLAPAATKQAAEKLLPAKRSGLPKFLFKEDSALMKEKVAVSS